MGTIPAAGRAGGGTRGGARSARGRAVRSLLPLALLAAPLWSGAALAYTPADVVAATPASERTLRQGAAAAAAEASLAGVTAGTEASLRLAPELDYGADIEDPAAFGRALALELELGWRYDRAAVLGARADALYALERLRHWQRVDVRDALRLLGRSLRAELALERAQLDLARARAAAGGAARERAEALVAARRHALEALRADADALGFAGDARLEPGGFVLAAAPAAAPQRRRLALKLAQMRAELLQDTTFAMLRDVTLDATYESKADRYQLTGRLSLNRGRPGAALAAELGPQQDDQWRVRLSADIRLDSSASLVQARADERVRRAQAEAIAADRHYPGRLAETRTAVSDARAALDAELAAWRLEARRVEATATGGPDGDPGATPTAGACRSLLARENAVYGAWLGLLSAVFDYLEVVDGSWSLSPAAGGPDGDSAAATWPARPSACAGPLP